MQVLVSGASGFVGSAIVDALRARGDDVGRLMRGNAPAEPLDVRWDPAAGTIDEAALAEAGFDAVVHLAGEPIVGRWTDAKRERILLSRVDGTSLLAGALARLDPATRPEVLACASGVGFYGDGGTRLLTENSPRGDGFLAGVVDEWEAAAAPAREAGMRTVHLRQGAVQGLGGGPLAKLLPVFRAGLGGPVGSGDQFLAWIGLGELARVFLFALDTPAVEGVVNAVGPTPCTNAEHAKALARVLGRPSLIRMPAFAMRLAMGQLAEELLLFSQKVAPMRLEGLGYAFEERDIEEALRAELGR